MMPRIFLSALLSLVVVALAAFGFAERRAHGATQLEIMRPLTGYGTVLTETSTLMSAATIGGFVGWVRVVATTPAFIDFASTNPFASNTTGLFLPANQPELFRIGPGGFFAVRSSDIGGTRGYLYLEGMSR